MVMIIIIILCITITIIAKCMQYSASNRRQFAW